MRREIRMDDDDKRTPVRVPLWLTYAPCDRRGAVPYWVMKNREKIAIRDMSPQHLRNAIRLLLRWAVRAKFGEELGALAMMSTDMPDGVADALSHEAAALAMTRPDAYLRQRVPVYRYLIAERDRRAMG